MAVSIITAVVKAGAIADPWRRLSSYRNVLKIKPNHEEIRIIKKIFTEMPMGHKMLILDFLSPRRHLVPLKSNSGDERRQNVRKFLWCFLFFSYWETRSCHHTSEHANTLGNTSSMPLMCSMPTQDPSSSERLRCRTQPTEIRTPNASEEPSLSLAS